MSVHASTPRDGNVPRDAHPEILMLVRYWQYIRPEGRLPGSADFNLDDIPGLRPNMRLLDVVEGGPFRYRIRMIGEEHRRQLGYDPTGSWYENITDRFKNSIVELDLARVCHWMQPVYRKGETIVPYASGSRNIERVHVPLASDGHHVDAIASLTLFFPDVRKAADPRSATEKPEGSDDTNLLAPVPADERETASRRRLETKGRSRPSV
jgi:hypothetical protein